MSYVIDLIVDVLDTAAVNVVNGAVVAGYGDDDHDHKTAGDYSDDDLPRF